MRLVVARWLVAFALIGTLASIASAQTIPSRTVRTIESMLTQTFLPNQPGAAVLVARGGKVILRRGYGLADVEHGKAVQTSDVFRIGSMTQQFTAVAILQLSEKGKLNLDDNLARYVPQLPDFGQPITLTELLSHTSGLPDYTDRPRFSPGKAQSLEEVLDLIKDRHLQFEPGTAFSYCNTDYRLLAAVIEHVSGQSYGDYLRDNLFRPAGMTKTYGDETAANPAPRIPGYHREGTKITASDPAYRSDSLLGSGNLLSNLDDLWIWERALDSGTLLSPKLLARARTSVRLEPDGKDAGYGFGWFVRPSLGHPAHEHPGSVPGFASESIVYEDSDLLVIVLCNSDAPRVDPEVMARRIANLILFAPKKR